MYDQTGTQPVSKPSPDQVGTGATLVMLQVMLLGLLVPAASNSLCASVVDFGARGNGFTDDTVAFQRAIDSVANSSGCVWVPPCSAGSGYVLTSTVNLPYGVSLIGSPSGFAAAAGIYRDNSFNNTGGSRILARPSADLKPLFQITALCTIRGLFIDYDRMPYPTDAEFTDPSSPFYYSSFEKARKMFFDDHLPKIGPTIYVVSGTRFIVEDVIASGFRDFIYCKSGGQSHIRRVHGWGYGTFIAVESAHDVMSFQGVHFIVNAGPRCVGPLDPSAAQSCAKSPSQERCRGNFTWIPGIVASNPNNVGIWMGRSDGYVTRDAFFFGLNTAMRFGYSQSVPMVDPTKGVPAPPLENAHGPWGSVSDLMVDQSQIGLHFVWPNPLTNRFSNIQIHPSFADDRTFPASTGTGDLSKPVALETAVLVDFDHTKANNDNLPIVLMLTNFYVASFADVPRFGPAASTLTSSNGRVFLFGGEVLVEVSQFGCNNVANASAMLYGATKGTQYSLRMRGVILNGQPIDDIRFPIK